jgi:hypothetical protein
VQAAIFYGTAAEIGAMTPSFGTIGLVSDAVAVNDCAMTGGGAVLAVCIYRSGWAAAVASSFGGGATNITGLTDDVAPEAPAGTNEFVLYVDRTSQALCHHINGEASPFCVGGNGTPTTAADACTPKTLWADANFVYVCVASGDIRRAAIATW